jgi:hypothetical protein
MISHGLNITTGSKRAKTHSSAEPGANTNPLHLRFA